MTKKVLGREENVTSKGRKKPQSRIWLSFSVSGFHEDPEVVTHLLKLSPSRVIREGELIGTRKKVRQEFNIWSIKYYSKSFDLELMLEKFLNQMRNVRKLKSRLKQYNARLSIVLELAGQDTRPTLHISEEQIRRLGALGISVWIDYYLV